ncbi:MAG: alpha-keto acid decarboxylase family protein [Sarcina sp.]
MKIQIGNYLIKRLSELGVKDIFGVPGDYNLGFLDLIEDSKDVEWIGNCNELNAAYAADGYGRINGMAAIVTTFGVGELSAINGVAGSFTENVPVVKIVGSPSTMVQANRALVHHSTGEGEFDTFDRIFKEVTVAQAILTEQNAASEIDRILVEVYKQKRPGYINLSVDIVSKEIEVEMKPLNLEMESNEETLNKFVKRVEELIKESKGQFILADYMVLRTKTEKELEKFINLAKVPCSTLSMGKGVIDETNPNFVGVYTGELSSDIVKTAITNSDLAFLVGVKLTDSTTGGFSYINPNITRVQLGIDSVRIGREIFTNITLKDALEALGKLNVKFTNSTVINKANEEKFIATEDKLTQNRYFKQMEDFIEENDIVVAEQGTSFFGASVMNLKKGVSFVGQPLWGSIGYTVGAILGTQLADRNRRNILLVGDGSFQLTAQEVSTILRQELNTVLFVINNDGYTVERAIHGPRRKYNDIQMWDYHKLPEVFAPNAKKKPLVFNVKTEKELEKALKEINNNKDSFALVEVHMDKDDVPTILGDLAKALVKQNAY